MFASSFRILVTLRQPSRSVVFLPSKYHESLRQKFFEPKYHNQSALDGFSILHCNSASSTFLHGLSGRNMWNSFDMLNHASTTQKIVCSFELSLFSCILTLVYQLIVRSNCAFVLSMLITLVVRQAILSWMTWRNKLQYLLHIQDWVKEVVPRRSNC